MSYLIEATEALQAQSQELAAFKGGCYPRARWDKVSLASAAEIQRGLDVCKSWYGIIITMVPMGGY